MKKWARRRKNKVRLVHGLLSVCTGLFSTGCYTIKQGYGQAQLLLQRQTLEEVLEQATEPRERLEKLRLVPRVLDFAENEIGLSVGSSYRTYIALDRSSVSYIVQAAERRRLERKTWWFPVVGSQPYLGFFVREDAERFEETLKEEGYDTRIGGVSAFSMLGYFPDPLYSSMIDGRSLAEVVDLIIHECVHRTLYVPGSSTFNESFANFVAQRATSQFFAEQNLPSEELQSYQESYRREVAARPLFQDFLQKSKRILKEFYGSAEADPKLSDEESFLAARQKIFDQLSADFQASVAPSAEGTWFARAFRKGAFNNAHILAYSLYESKSEPFEQALLRSGEELSRLIRNLQDCFGESHPENESHIWTIIEECPRL